jgi:hypothetical protein
MVLKSFEILVSLPYYPVKILVFKVNTISRGLTSLNHYFIDPKEI